MDILSHTLSGVAIGATAIHFNNKGFKFNAGLILVCGFAAFFPDLDVITYWSGFDETIGDWFSLEEKGKTLYHQKRWFSHHGLFHSFLMAILFTVVISLFFKAYSKQNWKKVFVLFKLELFAVLLSYLVHLFEDMPTPDFVWGGVAFMFPSNNYWGGKGYIWWWNNYDLFLIILSVGFFNMFFKLLGLLLKLNTKFLAASVLVLGCSLYLTQMLSRPHDFNYSGMSGHHNVWHSNEAKSKAVQKEILGTELYQIMERFDNALPLWF